jgi:hypothetical protein
MANNKPPAAPPPQVAPEFSSRKSLAAILKPAPASSGTKSEADDGLAWTVFGVGAIWRSAAENAARISGQELGHWMTAAIDAAAASQGVAIPSRDAS